MIHFFWTSAKGAPLPKDAASHVETWRKHHPDFLVRVWSLAELRPLLADFHGLRVTEAIDACRFPAMQSDGDSARSRVYATVA
jgi:mannosyltransferase OCH1-like enzyme